ncbi:hypothetical protein [Streptomyces olivaceus]|uniref:hypothetical protein n=1 Tax=Streptomyces olivaceus TaxID=47716 RepID=UPI0022EE625C|nr:hypothetical protein [Streptomyces olivaceus]GHI91703.1 hypothetical protein TPA0905_11740 [Streptomyces olivaceus]
MSEHPYTDTDLRTEAAICLLALSTTPGAADIRRWLTGAYVESRRADDHSGPTWDDLLTDGELNEVADRVRSLVESAADITQWAVNLGADNLQPSTEHEITLNAGQPIARIHFAFEPGMPEEMRTDLVEGIGDAINEAGADREDDADKEPVDVDSDSDVFDLISEIASKLRDATDSGEYHAVGLIYDLAMSRTTVAEARAELADIEFRHV